MATWILSAAFLAVASAAPQSYIVGPGHFHYEFGGENTYKYSTPAPVVQQISTPSSISTLIPVAKQDEYRIKPLISYKDSVLSVTEKSIPQQLTLSQVPIQQYSVRNPIAQQVKVSKVPVKQYTIQQYPTRQRFSGQNYNLEEYDSQRYDTRKYVSQPLQVSKVSNYAATPIKTETIQTVSVQRPQVITAQPVQNSYTTRDQYIYNNNQYAILRYLIDIQPEGTYNYAYETENGIKAEEAGELKNVGTENEAQVAQGFYSYTAPDGVVYTVRYIADENGFRAEGDHIPKVPETIQRSLEYLRNLPPRPDEQ